MGITSRLMPTEVTTLCDTVPDPEDTPGADGLADIDRFARFMRATKAPPRDAQLADTANAKKGSVLFNRSGCAACHVRTLVTAPAGTPINGGTFTVPDALGGKQFHPFSDFLLHDVGTGDGIVIPVEEHFGRAYREMQPTFNITANRMRTPPLWGVRTRRDRKSTRLNSSHGYISYAVFCLKKKKKKKKNKGCANYTYNTRAPPHTITPWQ